MAQQATATEDGATDEQTTEDVTHRNPIDWESVEEDTLGTHSFDADLYDAATFDGRRPAYYRTGKTRDGRTRQRADPMDLAPPTEAVVDFIESANTPDAIGQSDRQVSEEVAITPTEDELNTFKDEFDNRFRSRRYEPPFLRVPFFSERIVGDRGLSAAYGLVIGNARNADDPDYEYAWEADYEAGEVTITVRRTGRRREND